jgi:hypothetical protein
MLTNARLLSETLGMRGGADSVRKAFKLAGYACRGATDHADYRLLRERAEVGVWKERVREPGASADPWAAPMRSTLAEGGPAPPPPPLPKPTSPDPFPWDSEFFEEADD